MLELSLGSNPADSTLVLVGTCLRGKSSTAENEQQSCCLQSMMDIKLQVKEHPSPTQEEVSLCLAPWYKISAGDE